MRGQKDKNMSVLRTPINVRFCYAFCRTHLSHHQICPEMLHLSPDCQSNKKMSSNNVFTPFLITSKAPTEDPITVLPTQFTLISSSMLYHYSYTLRPFIILYTNHDNCTTSFLLHNSHHTRARPSPS